MNTLIELLKAEPQLSGYKIRSHSKQSYELFYVKGRLETVRSTDTCDREVTVYVDHNGCKGDAMFFVYPSTTPEQLREKIQDAVGKALLIENQDYALPEQEQGSFTVQSNFADQPLSDLAARIADAVFAANDVPSAALNAVEIFVNRHSETVRNSRGLCKTQVYYDAMVEAIPTYNGAQQSVELYEQYNFGSLDEAAIRREIGEKLEQVKARYEAVKPDFPLDCPCVLNRQELSTLFEDIVRNLDYSSVYSHSNLFSKGDAIQKEIAGDAIGITMTGEIPGSVRSAKFDADGLSLRPIRLVEGGRAVNYYGANRYGQYLGETPTGQLPCCQVDAGSAEAPEEPYLEVVSMSGLQVDFHSDYIGGEVRLACYHQGGRVTPVTGISISGKLSQVLGQLRLSKETAVFGGYSGPAWAILRDMKIF